VKIRILFLSVVVIGFVIRIWRIDNIPFIPVTSLWLERLPSVISGVISIILIYGITKKIIKIEYVALLTSFLFSVNAWSIEQGRIPVIISISSLFVLVAIYGYISFKKYSIIRFLSGIIILVAFILYPGIKLISSIRFPISWEKTLPNMFHIFSFDYFFFKNDSFWNGGVRTYGILFISLLPFLIIGLSTIIHKKIIIPGILFVLMLLLFGVIDPNFPETRVFYYLLPFILMIVALGLFKLKKILRPNTFIIFIIPFVLIFTYELSSFLHEYTIHYPIRSREYFMIHKGYD